MELYAYVQLSWRRQGCMREYERRSSYQTSRLITTSEKMFRNSSANSRGGICHGAFLKNNFPYIYLVVVLWQSARFDKRRLVSIPFVVSVSMIIFWNLLSFWSPSNNLFSWHLGLCSGLKSISEWNANATYCSLLGWVFLSHNAFTISKTSSMRTPLLSPSKYLNWKKAIFCIPGLEIRSCSGSMFHHWYSFLVFLAP